MPIYLIKSRQGRPIQNLCVFCSSIQTDDIDDDRWLGEEPNPFDDAALGRSSGELVIDESDTAGTVEPGAADIVAAGTGTTDPTNPPAAAALPRKSLADVIDSLHTSAAKSVPTAGSGSSLAADVAAVKKNLFPDATAAADPSASNPYPTLPPTGYDPNSTLMVRDPAIAKVYPTPGRPKATASLTAPSTPPPTDP
jgi:hypothetical protein